MIPDLKLQQLRYFVLVADLRSYHAAAERASRTQPALSLAIRELEQRLGEDLFEKGNKAALTPFGRQCYPLARALLEHYDRAVDHMAMTARRQIGRVAIACVPSFASQLLPPILQSFAGDHPGIQISVEDDTAQNVQQRVLNRHVDFGVTSVWELHPNLEFDSLFRDRVGLVCRRDHHLAALDRPLRWPDLARETLITNGTVRLLDGTEARNVMAEAHFSVSNVISLMALLRAGMGITTLPQLALPDNDPDLCFIPLDDPRVEREIGILTARRESLSPPAKALHACIVAHLDSAVDGAAGQRD